MVVRALSQTAANEIQLNYNAQDKHYHFLLLSFVIESLRYNLVFGDVNANNDTAKRRSYMRWRTGPVRYEQLRFAASMSHFKPMNMLRPHMITLRVFRSLFVFTQNTHNRRNFHENRSPLNRSFNCSVFCLRPTDFVCQMVSASVTSACLFIQSNSIHLLLHFAMWKFVHKKNANQIMNCKSW